MQCAPALIPAPVAACVVIVGPGRQRESPPLPPIGIFTTLAPLLLPTGGGACAADEGDGDGGRGGGTGSTAMAGGAMTSLYSEKKAQRHSVMNDMEPDE